MTALPSRPAMPDGYLPARELKAGNRILLGHDYDAGVFEVLSVELIHYYDGPSRVIPSEARLVIKAVNVYGVERTIETELLEPIEVLP